MNFIKRILSFFKKRILIDLDYPTAKDFELIEILFKEGVEKKSYTNNIVKHKFALRKNILEMINNNGITKDLKYRMVRTYICTYDNLRIGFITIAVNIDRKEIEIWYFSIKKEFQNYGLGKKYLDILFSMLRNDEQIKNYILFVRCNKYSEQMIMILEKNGFYKKGSNKQGFDFYWNNKILK